MVTGLKCPVQTENQLKLLVAKGFGGTNAVSITALCFFAIFLWLLLMRHCLHMEWVEEAVRTTQSLVGQLGQSSEKCHVVPPICLLVDVLFIGRPSTENRRDKPARTERARTMAELAAV